VKHARRGLALPAAIFTLAIIALFIAGSAFTASQEARASLGTLAERSAIEAAEYGVVAVLRDWDRRWNTATPVGQTLGPFTHNLADGATAQSRVTRTSLTTWWVTSEGLIGATRRREARRMLNAVFRLDLMPALPDYALGVGDSAQVVGTGIVIGTDSTEAIGICSTLPIVPVAGVAAPDTTHVLGLARITGNPPLLPDSTPALVTTQLDSAVVPTIVLPDGAIITPAPVVSAGVCDTLATTNWGDPSGGVCANHFPIIRALGDVTVRGGTGQGILIAAGDVRFESGAMFSGIVTPRDDFVTGSGGGFVLGMVVAGDTRRGAGDHTVVGSGAGIRRSSCRVQQVRLATANPTRVTRRWWAEFN
jgi:hypothetical protein